MYLVSIYAYKHKQTINSEDELMAHLDLALPLDAVTDQAHLDCVPISDDADAQQMRWTDWSQLLTTAQLNL
jgi:hypothetical protein